MVHPVFVQALPGYRLLVRYCDGVEGEVDLSEFAGKGIFAAWHDPEFFRQVSIGEYRQIRWSNDIELCADAIYMKLTGKTPEEYFSTSAVESAHA